jgi:hypothetical protein
MALPDDLETVNRQLDALLGLDPITMAKAIGGVTVGPMLARYSPKESP